MFSVVRHIRGWAATIAAVLLLLDPSASSAQNAAQPTAAEPPPQVAQLLNLLRDPVVQQWLIEHTPPDASAHAAVDDAEVSISNYAGQRRTVIRDHLASLVATIPRLPGEFERAGHILASELRERGVIGSVALVIGFVAFGIGAEWLLARATARTRAQILALDPDRVGDRLRAIAMRFALAIGLLAAFALGSVGAFLVFDWPPLLFGIVLFYLVAFVLCRFGLVIGRFVLAPTDGREPARIEHLRILPMSAEAARFWFRRLALIVGWFAFGFATVHVLDALQFTPDARRIVAYTLGLGLLGIGVEMVWRRPVRAAATEERLTSTRTRRNTANWLISSYFALVWLLWVASAIPAFWFAVFVVALPSTLNAMQRAFNHILRPSDAASDTDARSSLLGICIERAIRIAVIVGAILLLASAWHIDLVRLASTEDSLARHLLRGVLSTIVIVLGADFAWHLMKAMIDRKLMQNQQVDHPDPAEGRRLARLRTLLPILRNLLFITLLSVVILMVLSAIGIEIGPLIAGAGVIGVAIGFGAQTVVRDIISGLFYLLDDAFRIGEYIQSGNHKGTVESFSLRSIKLRHHRGPIYIVPFGQLGSIQNMSRDWVIDILSVGVTYDSDLDKARKIIKQIGQDLLQDPELAPNILETLKMQGVDKFGDFAIQLRMKIMTKPGEQFVIRRRAYAMIKKAFDAGGIRFAFPTVQVAGGDDASGAVARQSLELINPTPS